MDATAQAAQAIARSAQQTAQWFGFQATANWQATQAVVHWTATAEVMAITVAAARANETATASRQSTLDALADASTLVAITSTAIDNQSKATVTIAESNARSTIVAGEAESVTLAVERERMTNRVQAFAPWAVLTIVLLVLIYIILRRNRIILVSRDARGDARLMIIGNTIYDPDRNPAPVLHLSDGKPSTPIPADPATVARDQAIDLAHRGLPGEGRKRISPGRAARLLAPEMQAKPHVPTPPVRIHVLPPGQAKPIARDVLPSMLLDVVEGEIVEDEGGEA